MGEVGHGGRGWERVGEVESWWERVGEGHRGWERVGEGHRGWDRVRAVGRPTTTLVVMPSRFRGL